MAVNMDNNKENNNEKKNDNNIVKATKAGLKKAGVGKAIRGIIMKVVTVLLPIIMLGLMFYAAIALIVDFFSGIADAIADFFTIDKTRWNCNNR